MCINTSGDSGDNIPLPVPVALPSGFYLYQRRDWCFFDQVQGSNLAVSTLLSANPSLRGSISYFQFVSYSQKNSFIDGRMLHIRAYPNSNWDVVPQD